MKIDQRVRYHIIGQRFFQQSKHRLVILLLRLIEQQNLFFFCIIQAACGINKLDGAGSGLDFSKLNAVSHMLNL